MHVMIVGTYPPAQCGIATFTADTEAALRLSGVRLTIVPVLETTVRPGAIQRDNVASYEQAALWVNESGADIVLIEHEFGIFGGEAGSNLLSFSRRLTIPYAITLHTVLPKFSLAELAVVSPVCSAASLVTVFTPTARRLMIDQGVSIGRRLQVLPHGAPIELYQHVDIAAARAWLGIGVGSPVISTFGLLSSGKGIETVIEALAELVVEHPTIRYVVAGKTHPGVLRSEGEQYRSKLKALARKLGVEDNVIFVDQFLDVEDLAKVLAVSDVFCTPYHGQDQSVSGALTFALAAGRPVVSTPYRYACDVLSSGAGILVGFDNPGGFAGAIHRLLTNGRTRGRALRAAQAASRSLSWPSIGKTLAAVLGDAVQHAEHSRRALLNDDVASDSNDSATAFAAAR
jgi:glycosyltransferase involved in cell wall biosynthesis